jgi:Ca2+-binding EF-hand superfamily protein
MTPSKTSFIHALSIAAVLACAAPLSAMAADAQQQAPDTTPTAASPAEDAFKAADANHDSALSKEEVKSLPGIASQFSTLDKNADGVLSYDEFQAGLKPASSK